jgi:hypothetical protein
VVLIGISSPSDDMNASSHPALSTRYVERFFRFTFAQRARMTVRIAVCVASQMWATVHPLPLLPL